MVQLNGIGAAVVETVTIEEFLHWAAEVPGILRFAG